MEGDSTYFNHGFNLDTGMIDFIKTFHPYLEPAIWLENPDLSFAQQVDFRTGEVYDMMRPAKYNGMTFQIKPKNRGNGYSCLLDGSLHKYFNNGGHNASQFAFEDLKGVINDLSSRFGIQPRYTAIRSLEFGLNLRLQLSPQSVFKEAFCYKNKMFSPIDKQSKDTGIRCGLSEYELKIYDKRLQSKLQCHPPENSPHLLRFEIKIKKMRFLKRYGIRTMADLMDSNKVGGLKELLLQALDKIIFVDYDLDSSVLPDRQRKKFDKFRNPLFWSECSKSEMSRGRKTVQTMMEKYSKKRLKDYLRDAIALQWDALFET